MINIEELKSPSNGKSEVVTDVISQLEQQGYEIFEVADKKPWGAYIRLTNEGADAFIREYFPGLSPVDARLGIEGASLSPKILIVSPEQRLSWQYHHRRAERWMFLTDGAYRRSVDDTEGGLIRVKAGEVVQFAESERHRLEGLMAQYVFVAEIWQHTRPEDLSDEGDIVRVQDDYAR